MKMLFCELCGDIIAPHAVRVPRYCACLRHATWWEDDRAGLLYVWANRPEKAWVLGIDNRFLMAKEDVRHWYSPEVVIRVRPGSTWDTFVVPDGVSVEAFLYARQRMAMFSQEAEDRAIRGMQQFVGGWASHDHWVRAMRERAWLIENQSLLLWENPVTREKFVEHAFTGKTGMIKVIPSQAWHVFEEHLKTCSKCRQFGGVTAPVDVMCQVGRQLEAAWTEAEMEWRRVSVAARSDA